MYVCRGVEGDGGREGGSGLKGEGYLPRYGERGAEEIVGGDVWRGFRLRRVRGIREGGDLGDSRVEVVRRWRKGGRREG